jgi:hypothetical protein
MDLEQVFIREEIPDTTESQIGASGFHRNEAVFPDIKLELTEAIKEEAFEIKEESDGHSKLPLNLQENDTEIPIIKKEPIEDFAAAEPKSVDETFVDVFENKK